MKQARRLVLHFDINKTILMKDKATGRPLDSMIGGILAHSLWGKVTSDGNGNTKWTLTSESLNERPAEEDVITYGQVSELNPSQYVDDLYPKKTEEEVPDLMERIRQNKKISMQRSTLFKVFGSKGNPGSKFKGFFDKMMKTLTLPKHVKMELGVSEHDEEEDLQKWESQLELDQTEEVKQPQEPPESEVHKDAAVIEEEKVKQLFRGARFNIIPSFFKTLSFLRKSKREFAIVFRTFGNDLDDVILEFNRFCEGKHPCFNGKGGNPLVRFDGNKGTKDYRIQSFNRGLFYRGSDLNYPSSLVMGTLDRCKPGQDMSEYYSSRIEEGEVNLTSDDPCQIIVRFNQTLQQTCAIAIQDDYRTWNQAGEISEAGKPLYIDPSDHSTQHIFFDDNADPDQDCIVDVRDIVTNDKIPYHKVINKYMVKVEPIRAILESDYFIKQIEICEQNRDYELEHQGMPQDFQEEAKDMMLDDFAKLQTLPTQEYLSKTVLPVLFQGMRLATMQRPKNPLRFLAFYLLKHQDLVKLPMPPPQ